MFFLCFLQLQKARNNSEQRTVGNEQYKDLTAVLKSEAVLSQFSWGSLQG